MTIAQEEVFGPVFTVVTYEDVDDAIRIANDSPYGLTGAIFTRDVDLALRVGTRSAALSMGGALPGDIVRNVREREGEPRGQ